jgi:hypothetical protein
MVPISITAAIMILLVITLILIIILIIFHAVMYNLQIDDHTECVYDTFSRHMTCSAVCRCVHKVKDGVRVAPRGANVNAQR